MNTIKNKKRVRKRNYLIIVLLLLILTMLSLFIGILFTNSLYKKQFSTYVNVLNSRAENNYKIFNISDEFRRSIKIPSDGTYYVYGDCSDNYSYKAYQNDFIEKDILFLGEEYDKPVLYWCAKATNGTITDVWSSNYSLSENDLHEYTYEEQLNNYRFFKKYEKFKVVGYYKANQGDK